MLTNHFVGIGAMVGLSAGALLARRAPKPLFIASSGVGAFAGGYGGLKWHNRQQRLALERAVRQAHPSKVSCVFVFVWCSVVVCCLCCTCLLNPIQQQDLPWGGLAELR